MGELIYVDGFISWIKEFAQLVAANRDLLTELDSAIGDADHGINMDRALGVTVAALENEPPPDVAALCKQVALEVVSSAGGASGPLYGTLFLRMASTTGNVESIDPKEFSAALRAGMDGLAMRGKTQAGDKTMYDALAPAVSALDEALASGAELGAALDAAAAAAEKGRDATTPMIGLKGRASYLGERSIGHQDPGATSMALLIRAAATTLAQG
ncbi:dihydroxyacetone kinase subunit DhaL [Antrihabitans stalactiti]|uniref:Dihydroxyacetone kinase subunit L n=1 Tax=Antrihabitans stalactiti TaxID=2584121 RepID=A0A848K8Q9_9NOCA|nr:dihydroxyacetone kinase subunit DhaL [Antrihabitans stalactiti]NMN93674.1 dihydroxyacetone kinase subunit L [Antrihabitans stalactiti]